jgi:L-amino acid N-acyltransferase YncA
MHVRAAHGSDCSSVAELYNHYIHNSHATFETELIDEAEMLGRWREGSAAGYPFLVAESDGGIVGYAYGRRFRPRFAYLHSIEVSVYIKAAMTGQGVGSILYKRLLTDIRESGKYHAVIGGISLPNDASIRLHERFGFEKVAHFREVGRKMDRWIDVGYWQLIL